MKKIPTLFKRDPNDMAHVTDEVNPECQWVLDGEGVATRKYDGTCVMLDEDGYWWARREVKPGKTPPSGWVEADHDETTGKRPGWEPIAQSPFLKFHTEALALLAAFGGGMNLDLHAGTFELVGPKINGNPERTNGHRLYRHDMAEQIELFDETIPDADAEDYRMAVTILGEQGWEGIVWHHPDGRMAKLKGRDYLAATSPAVVPDDDAAGARGSA